MQWQKKRNYFFKEKTIHSGKHGEYIINGKSMGNSTKTATTTTIKRNKLIRLHSNEQRKKSKKYKTLIQSRCFF